MFGGESGFNAQSNLFSKRCSVRHRVLCIRAFIDIVLAISNGNETANTVRSSMIENKFTVFESIE